jgi:toxin ParE1/3/4
MDIRLSQEAEQDLIEIFDYILEDNPAAAEKVLNSIQQEIIHLSDHPHLGKPGRVPKTRELVLSNIPFIVPYQVNENTLEILRVYHSARRWPEEFKK